MSKAIDKQAVNEVTIVGKLVNLTHREGTTKTGKPYISARANVRVHQQYLGNDETSEITTSYFAPKFTSKGTNNSAYDAIMNLCNMKTIESAGLEEADVVRLRGNSTSLRENSYVGRNGSLIDTWEIDGRFPSKGFGEECASFKVEMVILDKRPEINYEGDETGRLLIKGGVVGYGPKLDVFEFVVDDPNAANQVDNAWDINATVTAWGRIRVITKEDKKPTVSSSWGEDAPVESNTRIVRELVLTGGNPIDDDDCTYDLADVKKLFNQRKADREQKQNDAAATPKAAAAPAKKSYGWE